MSVDEFGNLDAPMNSDHAPTAEEQLPPLSRSQITAELAVLASRAVATHTEHLGHTADAAAGIYAAYTIIRERQLLAALRENREKDAELEKEKNSRKHTQTWYASHYGKLEDWARKRLPEPWRNEFFSCIANGTWGHADVGERYRCNAGFDVVPSGYIHMDDAKGQLILDQTRRSEEAESQLAEKDARIAELESYKINADHALNLGILDSQELQAKLRAVSDALQEASRGADVDEFDARWTMIDPLFARIRAIVEGK